MADYVLPLSDAEVARYRLMAERAHHLEASAWMAAGIARGATVADVGCGPAAMSVVMASVVGPSGRIVGVERDPEALVRARQMVEQSEVDNVELRQADADATGIDEGSVDVAVLRHVLAHNGGREQVIVDHLASIVRPGGVVYLVDVDLSGFRQYPPEDDLADLATCYAEFHRRIGNDPGIGLRLGHLLSTAGLDPVDLRGIINIVAAPVGLRPPSWVARDAMVTAGVATEDDVARWGAAFEQLDSPGERPTIFFPVYIGMGWRKG